MEMETKVKKIPRQLQNEEFGFVKLPPRSKKPYENGWQDKPYTYLSIQDHIDQSGNYGVMGGHGCLAPIDVDKPEIAEIIKQKFPRTFTVKTPGNFFHFYYRCPGLNKKIILQKPYPDWLLQKIKDKTATYEEKDQFHYGEIMWFASQVVGPGSIHPDTGTAYEVVDDTDIATITPELIYSAFIDYIKIGYPTVDPNEKNSDIGITDILDQEGIKLRVVGDQLVGIHPVHGSKNNSNFVVHPDKNVWHCFRCNSGGGTLSLIAVLEGIIACSEAVKGGLKGDKYKKTCRIAKEKYGLEKENSTIPQGEVLTRMCEDAIGTFFTDQQGEPFVVLPIDDHLEPCSVKSARFRYWLSGTFRAKKQHPPNSDVINQAKVQLEGICSESPKIELFNRVGWHDGSLYYDLTDPNWQGVKITKDGWSITALPPVFRRYKHQVAQVTPAAAGDPRNFLRFCNIGKEDQCLFMCSVAAFFIPNFPHAMPYLGGTQGTAKTSTGASVKRLVDPSAVKYMSIPKNLEHAQMIAEKHWVSMFDNVSAISGWFSDFLCRAITGEGDMKRTLYTDDDEFIRSYRRCFVLNGIGSYAERPDLLDRSILIDIPKLDAVRSVEEMEAEWNEMLPGILGGFFTAVSQAMGIVDQIKGHDQFRMSDFARWGAALAGPLGYSKEEFFRKYQESVDIKWAEAADVNTLNGRIEQLMLEQPEWQGSFTDLLEFINPGLRKDKSLPETAKKLSDEIKRIEPLLRNSGIKIERVSREGGSGRKQLHISKVSEEVVL